MMVEGRLAGNELELEKGTVSSRRGRRGQRRPGPMPTSIQRLYDTCREVFSDGRPGIVPLPEDVDRLRSVLDNIKAADVGLTKNLPYCKSIDSGGAAPVTYLHLYECNKFSIGIFCLPPSAVIPLHNHPGMTVFSKLLFGSMHIKSYDWVDASENSNEIINLSHFKPKGVRLAKQKIDDVFTAPCETCILYPAAGGNMHRFTARTCCAVLDVLGPPYSDPEGRHCSYYNDFPCPSFSAGNAGVVPCEGEKYAWLEEREKPDDFFVMGAEYSGPTIVEH